MAQKEFTQIYPKPGWVEEYNMNVQVTAVIYNKRDQLYHLSKMDIE